MYLSASHYYKIKNRDVLPVIECIYVYGLIAHKKIIHGSAVTH